MKLARRLRKVWLQWKVADERWYKLLRECQEMIAGYDPAGYYATTYREHELGYWNAIPPRLLAFIEANPNRREMRVLDIGCAYGTLALFCQRAGTGPIHAIDFVPRYMHQTFAREHQFDFRVANIELEQVPWAGGFDIILFTEVLEHLNFHPVGTLRKIRGLLNPGGRLYLSTPDAARWGRTTKYYQSLEEIPEPGKSERELIDDHVWQYSEEEIRGVIESAGLKIIQFEYGMGTKGRHFNLELAAADQPEK